MSNLCQIYVKKRVRRSCVPLDGLCIEALCDRIGTTKAERGAQDETDHFFRFDSGAFAGLPDWLRRTGGRYRTRRDSSLRRPDSPGVLRSGNARRPGADAACVPHPGGGSRRRGDQPGGGPGHRPGECRSAGGGRLQRQKRDRQRQRHPPLRHRVRDGLRRLRL